MFGLVLFWLFVVSFVLVGVPVLVGFLDKRDESRRLSSGHPVFLRKDGE